MTVRLTQSYESLPPVQDVQGSPVAGRLYRDEDRPGLVFRAWRHREDREQWGYDALDYEEPD